MERGGRRGFFLLPGSLTPLLGLVHCIWENRLTRSTSSGEMLARSGLEDHTQEASSRGSSKCGRARGPGRRRSAGPAARGQASCEARLGAGAAGGTRRWGRCGGVTGRSQCPGNNSEIPRGIGKDCGVCVGGALE